MRHISIHGKTFTPYLLSADIQQRVTVLGEEISKTMEGKTPIFLSVLNGSFMFASDLLKTVTIPSEISFVKLASYRGTGTSGKVKQLIGLNEQLRGRSVVIVEDIIDTGITMNSILQEIREYAPTEIRIATMLFKPEAFRGGFEIDYIGFDIADDFVVGYGLDFDGLGRNYPDIYIQKT